MHGNKPCAHQGDLNQAHAEYSPAPDDQRFLMVRNSDAFTDKLVVVENWFAAYKARRP